jgi:hypothetical protein
MGAFNCASRVAFDDSRVMFPRAVFEAGPMQRAHQLVGAIVATFRGAFVDLGRAGRLRRDCEAQRLSGAHSFSNTQLLSAAALFRGHDPREVEQGEEGVATLTALLHLLTVELLRECRCALALQPGIAPKSPALATARSGRS